MFTVCEVGDAARELGATPGSAGRHNNGQKRGLALSLRRSGDTPISPSPSALLHLARLPRKLAAGHRPHSPPSRQETGNPSLGKLTGPEEDLLQQLVVPLKLARSPLYFLMVKDSPSKVRAHGVSISPLVTMVRQLRITRHLEKSF